MRAQNPTRTKALILSALSALLEEKPFSEVTVQDVAVRAAINRATFYSYFTDKYALLEDLVRDRYRALLTRHDMYGDGDVTAFIEAVALETLERVCTGVRYQIDKQFEPYIAPAMHAELYEFLLPALGTSAAFVVSATIVGAMLQWRAHLYQRPVNKVAHQLATVLSCGVRLPQRASLAAT